MISLFFILLRNSFSTCINSEYLNSSRTGYNSIINNFFQIENCVFNRFVGYSHNGGIIYFFNIFINSSIKNCVFFDCSAMIGGSIYMKSNIFNNYVFLSKCCFFNGLAQSYCHFILIELSQSKCILDFNSFNNCTFKRATYEVLRMNGKDQF